MENYFEMHMAPLQVKAISSQGLAHLGDGVYELLCRSHLCKKGGKTALNLHKDTVKLVKAASQARFAQALLPHLTEEEQDYVMETVKKIVSQALH